MFGSGLPVCALSYSCIGELVADGMTGLLFSSPGELAGQLQELLRGMPGAPGALLARLREGVARREQGWRWDDNWDKVAWPVLRRRRGEGGEGGEGRR